MRAAIISMGGELFTIDLKSVREVFVVESITPVPGMPSGLVGVTNLRGTVIPLLDLRPMFGLNAEAALRYAVVVQARKLAGRCPGRYGSGNSHHCQRSIFTGSNRHGGRGVSLRVDRRQVGGSAPRRVGNVGGAFTFRGDELTRAQQTEIARNLRHDQREGGRDGQGSRSQQCTVRQSQDADKAACELRSRQFHHHGDGDHRCGDASEVERRVTSGVRRLYGPIGRVR